jgi:hypothetical protein
MDLAEIVLDGVDWIYFGQWRPVTSVAVNFQVS